MHCSLIISNDSSVMSRMEPCEILSALLGYSQDPFRMTTKEEFGLQACVALIP